MDHQPTRRKELVFQRLLPWALVLGFLSLQAQSLGGEWATGQHGRPDLCLPSHDAYSEVVNPHGIEVPEECSLFLEREGEQWFVVWDRSLGTPLLVFPARGYELAPSGTSESIGQIVGAFVNAHAEFFGVRTDELSAFEAHPLDDGHVVVAGQVHEGLPVRGSYLRVRLDAGLRVRSISCRLARALPALEPAVLGAEEALDLAAADGIEPEGDVVLQVVFPGNPGSALAAWSVIGHDRDGTEREVLYAANDGRQLASLELELHFEVNGAFKGYSPPPDDIYSMSFQVTQEDLYRLGGARVQAEVGVNLQFMHFGPVDVASDGTFHIDLEGVDPGTPEVSDSYRLWGCLEDGLFWVNVGQISCESKFFTVPPPGGGPGNARIVMNEELAEFLSFQLMTFHHLRRAEALTDAALEDVGLPPLHETEPARGLEPGAFRAFVSLENTDFEHSYRPSAREIRLYSDEVLPQDPETGRWRKIVPTTIYHELGHHVFQLLTGGSRGEEANEGISDAFSAYVARVSTLGYVDPETPSADGDARDLRNDTVAYPLDRRRSIAGALWELWESTLDPDQDPGVDPLPKSSFAHGLLLRWLSAHTVPTPRPGALALELRHFTGVELFLEADHPRFRGDGDLTNGVPHGDELVRAFGRRNLFLYPFRRGDANTSGTVDISDAVTILDFLFRGLGAIDCPDAADANDSGEVDLSDGIYLLVHLFSGGAPPPWPDPAFCGWDRTIDNLGCWRSACLPLPWGAGEG